MTFHNTLWFLYPTTFNAVMRARGHHAMCSDTSWIYNLTQILPSFPAKPACWVPYCHQTQYLALSAMNWTLLQIETTSAVSDRCKTYEECAAGNRQLRSFKSGKAPVVLCYSTDTSQSSMVAYCVEERPRSSAIFHDTFNPTLRTFTSPSSAKTLSLHHSSAQ